MEDKGVFMKIVINDDKEVVTKIRNGLEKHHGHCPCQLTETDENKCMCKEFLESNKLGWCHCHLYKKIEL